MFAGLPIYNPFSEFMNMDPRLSDPKCKHIARNVTNKKSVERWRAAGSNAGLEGKSRHVCPFTKNSLEWKHWMRGYLGH